MSSPRFLDSAIRMKRRTLRLAFAAAISALALSGCGFQPLYGPTASGLQLTEVMKSVDITHIPGRVGQKVRNELIYGTTDGGYANDTVYKLDIALKESLRNTLVAKTGDPQGQVYELNAQFKLVRVKDNQVMFTGFSTANAAYDRAGTDGSVFADVRARRDAENRAARTIADNLKTRLAAFLSSTA